MKKSIILSLFFLGGMLFSQESRPTKSISFEDASYVFYGEKFHPENVISAEEMLMIYDEMELDEPKEVIFKGKINSVCQSKGCWMRLDLGVEDKESFVKFKDYAFFLPMDSAGSDAIIKGIASKKETSVEDLRHFAEDAGKSEEEIEKITEPKVEYTFVADGVMLSIES